MTNRTPVWMPLIAVGIYAGYSAVLAQAALNGHAGWVDAASYLVVTALTAFVLVSFVREIHGGRA